ncbi:MAG: hypothetical protein P1U63_08770 [Coxiellaceae bacterium]|nr:hypothetical protein [Coxiellaceae bacterium]
MADEKDKNGEEEYRYPEDEYVQSKSEPQSDFSEMEDDASTAGARRGSGGAGIMSKVQSLAQNRIFIIVLVVIIIFIVLRVVSSNRKAKTKVATKQPAVTQPVQTAAAPVDNNINSQQANIVQGEVSTLQTKVSDNSSSINQIEQQLNKLQNSIDGVANSRGNVNEAIAQLALQVKQLAAEIKKRPTAQVKTVVSVPRIAPVVYYLRAIVPGRAWIYGTNKRTASIMVGDRVKQYGRVLAINAPEGMVVTSSGKMIEFSSSDR